MEDKLKRNTEILKDRLHVASVLCNRSNIYYSRIKSLLLFPNMLISSVSMIFNNQNFDSTFLRYYNTIINSITVFLLAVQTQLKISENADIFKSSSNSLLGLLHELENAEGKSEPISSEFISNTNQRYDMIMAALPIIPSRIRTAVQNEYGGKFHLPIIINGIPKVSISSDEV